MSGGLAKETSASVVSGTTVTLTASGLSQYTNYPVKVRVTETSTTDKFWDEKELENIRTYCQGGRTCSGWKTCSGGTLCDGPFDDVITCTKCDGRGAFYRVCDCALHNAASVKKCPWCGHGGHDKHCTANKKTGDCEDCQGKGKIYRCSHSEISSHSIPCTHGEISSHRIACSHGYTTSHTIFCSHGYGVKHD